MAAPPVDLAPRVPITTEMKASPNSCRYEECAGAIPSRDWFPGLSIRRSSRRSTGGNECFVHL